MPRSDPLRLGATLLTLKIILTVLLTFAPTIAPEPAARPCESDADCSAGDVCRNGYCVARRVSDTEVLASDCNPARKDPPSGKDPSPPKDAPPPGGYNPKV